MAGENLLFHIDTIIVDGKPVAFEDGSGMISGAARYENKIVASASGNDFAARARVPTVLKLKIQFSNAVDPALLASTSGVQVTARDTQSGRRALMNNCMFGSLGDLGGGSVDITYNVLSPIQWL
jgi:hypothetical protein